VGTNIENRGQRTIQWGEKARVGCTRTERYGNRRMMNQRILAAKKRYYSCYVLLDFSKVRLRRVTTVQGFRHFIRWVTAESFCGGPRGTIDQSAFPFCLDTTETKNGIRGAKRRCDLNTKQFSITICGSKNIYRPSPVRLTMSSFSLNFSLAFSFLILLHLLRRLYPFLEFLLCSA